MGYNNPRLTSSREGDTFLEGGWLLRSLPVPASIPSISADKRKGRRRWNLLISVAQQYQNLPWYPNTPTVNQGNIIASQSPRYLLEVAAKPPLRPRLPWERRSLYLAGSLEGGGIRKALHIKSSFLHILSRAFGKLLILWIIVPIYMYWASLYKVHQRGYWPKQGMTYIFPSPCSVFWIQSSSSCMERPMDWISCSSVCSWTDISIFGLQKL